MNSCFAQGKKLVCMVCFIGMLLSTATTFAYSPTVTMAVADANLGVVLAEVARMGKANIVINVKQTDTITVTFDNVPFETALYYIARTKGLSIDKKSGNTYVVSSQEEMEKGFREVQIFPLKFARADHIKNVIVGGGKSDSEFAVENPGASGSGSSSSNSVGSLKGSAGGATASSANKEGIKGLVINTDASTNSVVAFGSPEQIATVRSLIKELDVPYQQILLEAQVMALSKNASKDLGIDWSWANFGASSNPRTTDRTAGTLSIASDGTTTYTGGSETINLAEATTSMPIFSVTGSNGLSYNFGFNAKLNALIANGEGKILARPNMMTFNGNKATIFVGDEIPVPKSENNGTSTNSTTSIEYKTAGITLSYVPRVNEDNQITASVFVEVSTPVADSKLTSGAIIYRITTRSAQTNVRMKDGDTLVIGGLISSSEAKSLNKVPFLGDLPILGQLFRSLSSSKNETEVVIFLKAKIVK